MNRDARENEEKFGQLFTTPAASASNAAAGKIE
jgi:hypothetical protein